MQNCAGLFSIQLCRWTTDVERRRRCARLALKCQCQWKRTAIRQKCIILQNRCALCGRACMNVQPTNWWCSACETYRIKANYATDSKLCDNATGERSAPTQSRFHRKPIAKSPINCSLFCMTLAGHGRLVPGDRSAADSAPADRVRRLSG